jgi:CheY-like chemotaxis protein
MNLLINARDAMPNGGRLLLSTRKVAPGQLPAAIDLPSGEYVAIVVEDSGVGMTPEVAARALEPFYTTKEIGEGSGLGLSTVYGFAKQPGGELQIDSAAGAGTRVTLYLPCNSGAGEQNRESVDANERRRGTGTILVVEDDVEVREISVEILGSLGYRILVARDGRETLDQLRGSQSVDLLFTDLVMPGGISGVALARQARAMRPGLRVLLATAYAAVEADATDEFPLIAKPFRSAELSQAIARALTHEDAEPWSAAAKTADRYQERHLTGTE